MECKFDHVHILTSDPEGVAVWFKRMLDAEIIRSMQGDKPRVDVKLGGQMIFIMPVSPSDVRAAPEHAHLGLDHFGLTVTDIDAVHEDLKRRGAEFSQNLHTQRPGIRMLFLRGPEGISVEVLERNEKHR
jgi:catechol 2,3-dioxygenase-like lactoylglutathione lyase family enzyme